MQIPAAGPRGVCQDACASRDVARISGDAVHDRRDAIERGGHPARIRRIQLPRRRAHRAGARTTAGGDRRGPVGLRQEGGQSPPDQSRRPEHQYVGFHVAVPLAIPPVSTDAGRTPALRAARWSASRSASATTVSVGLAWLEVGKTDELAT